MRICPGFASSHSREATLDTVPIAIVKSALEADCAERGEAVRNIDAEANVVPEPTPPIGKFKFREEEAGRDLSAPPTSAHVRHEIRCYGGPLSIGVRST